MALELLWDSQASLSCLGFSEPFDDDFNEQDHKRQATDCKTLNEADLYMIWANPQDQRNFEKYPLAF